MTLDPFHVTRPDGGRLLCGRRTAANADETHTFLLVPGFWGDWRRAAYTGIMERLSQSGGVFASNLRGHPGSSGWFTFGKREAADMGLLYRKLRDLGVREVTACGFSMGGWALAAHLAEVPGDRSMTRHLALAGVPSRLPWILPRPWRRGLWVQLRYGGKGWTRANPFALWPPRSLLPAAARLGDLPVTVIHGRRDWMVDDSHGRLLFDSLPGPKRWVLLEDSREPHVEMLAHFHGESIAVAILSAPK